jgi:hypothetical protein
VWAAMESEALEEASLGRVSQLRGLSSGHTLQQAGMINYRRGKIAADPIMRPPRLGAGTCQAGGELVAR